LFEPFLISFHQLFLLPPPALFSVSHLKTLSMLDLSFFRVESVPTGGGGFLWLLLIDKLDGCEMLSLSMANMNLALRKISKLFSPYECLLQDLQG
jgi:hypothetical protein